jgi:glycosyltransferase involved in cell wall biosynthesis
MIGPSSLKENILKILYITRKYPPSVGGMQKFNHDLVTELKKTVDVELIALGKAQYHLMWFVPYALFRGMGRRFDVIHLGDGLLAPVGWFLSKIKKKPYTITVHGLDITFINKLYQSAVVPYIKKADKIICVSENTRQLCIESGCEAERCTVIPNGIYAEKEKRPDKKKAREQLAERYNINTADLILLSVGRLVKRKGVAWFLLQVLPSLKSTTLIVAGEGPERENIIKAARGMEKVRILGRVEDELLPLLYRGSDAFIMPNIKVEGDAEGFGMVLLEAGQSGLYSFASNIDGIPAAVRDYKNGRLLESGSAGEWIKELSRFDGKRDNLEKMGGQAREYVIDNYSWGKIAWEYKNIWTELSGKPYNLL